MYAFNPFIHVSVMIHPNPRTVPNCDIIKSLLLCIDKDGNSWEGMQFLASLFARSGDMHLEF